jgi:hypothetical protein
VSVYSSGRRPKASRSETLTSLGPPARGNLTPTFANPDDATACFTRLELRQHQPGNAVVLAFPPMTGSTTEEEKAELRRAKNREYQRKYRAKRTVEQIDRQREHVRRHRAKVAAALPPY